jgi:hypothetical protein
MTPVSAIGPDGTSARGKLSHPDERKCAQLPRIHIEPTAQDRRGQGTFDTRHGAEEPDDAKASRPVLNPSRGGDTPA